MSLEKIHLAEEQERAERVRILHEEEIRVTLLPSISLLTPPSSLPPPPSSLLSLILFLGASSLLRDASSLQCPRESVGGRGAAEEDQRGGRLPEGEAKREQTRYPLLYEGERGEGEGRRGEESNYFF